MSGAAEPTRLKHGFWHVRLWEFVFLMLVGPMLFQEVMLVGWGARQPP